MRGTPHGASRRRARRLPACAVALGALAFAPTALAATFEVDTTSAGSVLGKTTLTEAVDLANDKPSANTIEFAPGLGAVQLPAAGLPAITDPHLTIDGCAKTLNGAGHGGCQQISAAAVTDGASGDGVIEVEAPSVTITGLKLDDSTGGSNDETTPLVYGESAATSLTLTDDTLSQSPETTVPAVETAGDDLLVGGLDSFTHKPVDGVTIDAERWAIYVDAGEGDLIEGNTLNVEDQGGAGGGVYLDGDDAKLIANSLAVPLADGGYGVEVGHDALGVQVGDPALQAPPNTFVGFTYGVVVQSDGAASFYDNTGAVAGSRFYIREYGGPAPPVIESSGGDAGGVISGMAPAGSTVELIGSESSGPPGEVAELDGVLATVTADDSGDWSWTPPAYGELPQYLTAIATTADHGSSEETVSYAGPVAREVTEAGAHNPVSVSSATAGAYCESVSTCWVPYMGTVTFTYHSDNDNGWGLREWGSHCGEGFYEEIQAADPTCTVQVGQPFDDTVSEWLQVALALGSETGDWGGSSVSAQTDAPEGRCLTSDGVACFLPPGADLTLNAYPGIGYQLESWGNIPGCPPASLVSLTCSLTDLQSPIFGQTVDFDKLASFTVSGAGVAPGSGRPANGFVSASSSSPGARCDAGECTVFAGGSVTLTAHPAAGYTDGPWSGACWNVVAPTCTVNDVQANISASEYFRSQQPQYTVTGKVNPGYAGTITASSAANGLGATCSGGACTVERGDEVTLKAVAKQTALGVYVFSSWSGCASGDEASSSVASDQKSATCTFSSVEADHTVIASFSDVVPIGTILHLNASGGLATVLCGGPGSGHCTGTVILAIQQTGAGAAIARAKPKKAKKKTKTVVIASGRFSIAKGKKGSVKLRASKAGRKYENAHRHKLVHAVETIRAHDPSGHEQRISRPIKVKLA
ncbi:MAG TPA: hypothetical protein VGF95_06105 [Solirubrobacteraceae bacterium]